MSQRQVKSTSHGIHLDSLVCEKYMSKLSNKEKQITQLLLGGPSRGREKVKTPIVERHLKTRPNVRQKTVTHPHQPQSSKGNPIQYSDDSALVEVTVTTRNPGKRSKSTADKESWSQMLKENKCGDKNSLFGNFDPLRTLHFISKELQLQLNSVLPNNVKIQQMVSDMQYAIRRIPPEIASQVHLLQGLEALGHTVKQSGGNRHVEEPERETLDCGIQTVSNSKNYEDNQRLQQLMAEGTLKLESSCRQMEKLCTDLKHEKNNLEEELSQAKREIVTLKKNIDDLELENNEILHPRVMALEEEKRKLSNQLKSVTTKYENQTDQTFNDLKSQITELRSQKSSVEKECNKFRHQVKVAALEREKFVAVLTLRDTQINEIRTEMGQLQELVNEQLSELHINAFQGAPTFENAEGVVFQDGNSENPRNYEMNGGNDTLATIVSNEGSQKQEASFKDLQSGDIDIANLPDIENMIKSYANQDQNVPVQFLTLDRLDSHNTIKNMFNEIKKTAYAIAGSQNKN